MACAIPQAPVLKTSFNFDAGCVFYECRTSCLSDPRLIRRAVPSGLSGRHRNLSVLLKRACKVPGRS